MRNFPWNGEREKGSRGIPLPVTPVNSVSNLTYEVSVFFWNANSDNSAV